MQISCKNILAQLKYSASSSVIPVNIGELGTVRQSLQKHLDEITGKKSVAQVHFSGLPKYFENSLNLRNPVDLR